MLSPPANEMKLPLQILAPLIFNLLMLLMLNGCAVSINIGQENQIIELYQLTNIETPEYIMTETALRNQIR